MRLEGEFVSKVTSIELLIIIKQNNHYQKLMKNFNSKNPCHIGVIGTAFSKVSPHPPKKLNCY